MKGERLTVFTKEYVNETAKVMRSLVNRIEHKIYGFLRGEIF
jgi:hypothetical protein